MAIFEVSSFTGLSDYNDRGIRGAFKFGANLDVRKVDDSLSSGQDLVDEGLTGSVSASPSPSSSASPSASASATASPSASTSPSSSASHSPSPSTGISPSPSRSPSASASPSASVSPSRSTSGSPSPSAGLSTVYDDLVLWFVKATDGNTYEFGSTGSIYKRDDEGRVTKVYKDAEGRITGACESPRDSGNTYLIWVSGTSIKQKQLPGRSDWNDVTIPYTNLNPVDWHTMTQINGSVMIANGSWVALVGYDGSYTNEALDLIPGNVSKTLVERNGRLIVGTGKSSDPDKSINGAIDTEIPLAQVGDEGELYYANMSDSVPVRVFPGGGKVNPGGVCNMIEQVNFFEWEEQALSWIDKQSVGNLSLWGVYDATTGKNGVYSYGRLNKNHPFTLNLDYQLEVDEIGAVTSVNGTVLISYRNGSDFGVKATDPDNKADSIWEGLELKGQSNKNLSEISEWSVAEIYCEPLPDGSQIRFKYKLDKNGDWITAYMESGSAVFQANGETKAVFQIGAKADIFEPRVELYPIGNTSPKVHRVRCYVQ